MILAEAASTAFAPARLAVTSGRIPGAVLGVGTADGRREVLVEGARALVPDHEPLDRLTVFDLASLTKVVVTVTKLLRLAEAGRIDLDDPIGRHLPEMPGAASALTVRALATHASGLSAHERFWETSAARGEALAEEIAGRDWPLGEPVYSDINYILLGLVVERAGGRPLARIPLTPGLTFRPDPADCATTEFCSWRGRWLKGEVHDENAAALGGVAGHAGLFGSVDGVLDFVEMLYHGRVLSAAALEEMRRPHGPERAFGWERRHPGWKGGSLCSASTIGHLGFTGVGVWIDWDRGVWWTLLTQRVHPSRDRDTGIQDLRRAVGNRLAAALSGGEVG